MTVPAAENLRRSVQFRAYLPNGVVASVNTAADLLDAIDAQVVELLAEHHPEWASDEQKAKGKDPIGCFMCFPHDGSWPCVSRRIADEMHALLHPAPKEDK